MKTNDKKCKQRFFPVRDANNPYKVRLEPISEQLHSELTPEIWRVRKRMQRSGQCTCPQGRLWTCDADCLACPYNTAGQFASMSTSLNDAGDLTLEDTIPDDITPTAESIIMDQELLEALYSELEALDPEGKRICQLMMHGSEREAAREMGLPRSTFKRQWDEIRAVLKERLKDYRD